MDGEGEEEAEGTEHVARVLVQQLHPSHHVFHGHLGRGGEGRVRWGRLRRGGREGREGVRWDGREGRVRRGEEERR